MAVCFRLDRMLKIYKSFDIGKLAVIRLILGVAKIKIAKNYTVFKY
jgi:hypothetical protein